MTTPTFNLDSEEYDKKVRTRRRAFWFSSFITLAVVILLVLTVGLFVEKRVVIKGEGEVVPRRDFQIVSNYNSGLVVGVFAQKGQVVEAGQVLFSIIPLSQETEYLNYHNQYLYLQSEIERLQALVEDKDLEISKKLVEQAPDIARKAMDRYKERRKIIENKKQIINQIILEQSHAVAGAQASINQQIGLLELAEQELKTVLPLVSDELISKRTILRLKMNIISLKGEISKAEASLLKDKETLVQARYELDQVLYNFKREDRAELLGVQQSLAALEKKINDLSSHVKRIEIRAPATGTIQDVHGLNVGGIINPEEKLLSLKPREGTFFVKASIDADDQVYLKLFQKTKITFDEAGLKADTFKGKVLEISRGEMTPDGGGDETLSLLIQADESPLEIKGKAQEVAPGVKVKIQISDGNQPLLSHWLASIDDKLDFFF